jgi:hypothetical protein
MPRNSLNILAPMLFLAVAAANAAAYDGATKSKAKKKPSWPKFSAVTEVVQRRLQSDRNYRSGDMISRGDLEPIFKELDALGWKPADRSEIEKQLLADSDFLVRELRTNAGRVFMRQVGRYPDGYGRLDHLADLSDGKTIVRRLIDGPDGYKLLEYLTTAPGGREMGNMLSQAPHGQNFNRPTGHIYTAEQLLERLKSSHAEAEKARAAASEKKAAAGEEKEPRKRNKNDDRRTQRQAWENAKISKSAETSQQLLGENHEEPTGMGRIRDCRSRLGELRIGSRPRRRI